MRIFLIAEITRRIYCTFNRNFHNFATLFLIYIVFEFELNDLSHAIFDILQHGFEGMVIKREIDVN